MKSRNKAVDRAVIDALRLPVYGATYNAVNNAVDDAVDRTVDWATYRAMHRAAGGAVYDAVDEDLPHPALQDFLRETR